MEDMAWSIINAMNVPVIHGVMALLHVKTAPRIAFFVITQIHIV